MEGFSLMNYITPQGAPRAIAALHALIEAYGWLQDVHDTATVASLPARTPVTRLTPRAAAARDRLVLAERGDRVTIARDGTGAAMGASPMPLRPAVLDAQVLAVRTVTDCAWLATSTLRRRPLLAYGPAWRQVSASTWESSTLHLRVALPWLACACPDAGEHAWHSGCWRHREGCAEATARTVATQLETADAAARAALGVGPAWHALRGVACPVCDRRTVEAECSAPDERSWTMRCAAGCWTDSARSAGAKLGRLGDLLALIASVRRQMGRRERRAA